MKQRAGSRATALCCSDFGMRTAPASRRIAIPIWCFSRAMPGRSTVPSMNGRISSSSTCWNGSHRKRALQQILLGNQRAESIVVGDEAADEFVQPVFEDLVHAAVF